MIRLSLNIERVFSCLPAGLSLNSDTGLEEIQSKILQRILLSLNSILLSPFAIIERSYPS